jgi:hypothetical protein
MQLRRAKRVISALTAIVMIVPVLRARDASCFCTSCDSDAGCCRAKSCCDSNDIATKPCGCLPIEDVATSGAGAANDFAVPQGCQCVSSASKEIAPITRAVQVDRHDWIALEPKATTLALHDGLSVRNVDLANIFASSGPPLRILYCSWLE